MYNVTVPDEKHKQSNRRTHRRKKIKYNLMQLLIPLDIDMEQPIRRDG